MMAQEAVRRVDSLLAEASVVEDALARTPDRNDVEFRDVTFTYPGGKAPALSHLSFQVRRENCGFGRRFGQWKDTAAP